MRIAALQFATKVGDINNNLNRADAVLSKANPDDIDLLVLPEVAFSGYNFKSLQDISPFLEPTAAGITSLWCRTVALKYNCVVAAGYPEKVDITLKWPTSPEYYNSLIVVNHDGETVANYRKNHLRRIDSRWALEGPNDFYRGYLPGVGKVAMGIGMDIDPYKSHTSWEAFEFAKHVIRVHANVVLFPLAWITKEDPRDFSRMPKEPDMETLTYWVKRLEPIIRSENRDEVIFIFANRCGTEGDAVYAGSSAVIGIKHGEVNVYGILGRGDKELLVVDTEQPPMAKLVYRPETEESAFESERRKEESDVDKLQYPVSGNSSEVSSASRSQGDSLEPSQETRRRIFGGHVFVTQDALTPLTAAFPTTPFEESPISPRYFLVPPEKLGPAYSPMRPSFPDEPVSIASHFGNYTAEQVIEDTSNIFTPRKGFEEPDKSFAPSNLNRREQGSQLDEVIEALRKTSSADDTEPAQHRSRTSRAASRTGRGERSNSSVGTRQRSVFGRRSSSAFDDIRRTESPKSRNASRNQSTRHRTGSESTIFKDPLMALCSDIVAIDADMMVFEDDPPGRPRTRRDSLECHPDEDEYVMTSRGQREHSHGRHSVRSPRANLPKRLDSPAFSPRHGSQDLPPIYSPGMPDGLLKSPLASDASRGRKRHAKTQGSIDSSSRLPDHYSAEDKVSLWNQSIDSPSPSFGIVHIGYPSPEYTPPEPLPLIKPLSRSSRRHNESSPRKRGSASGTSSDGRIHSTMEAKVEDVLPTTPESVPQTPKAMTLIPVFDTLLPEPQSAFPGVETNLLKCVERDDLTMERRRSMVW